MIPASARAGYNGGRASGTADCYFFFGPKGCRNGAGCAYRHCEAARLSSTACPAWAAGGECHAACPLRHPSGPPQGWPAQLGHPSSALDVVSSGGGKIACRFFASETSCRFGEACKFAHIEGEGAAPASLHQAAARMEQRRTEHDMAQQVASAAAKAQALVAQALSASTSRPTTEEATAAAASARSILAKHSVSGAARAAGVAEKAVMVRTKRKAAPTQAAGGGGGLQEGGGGIVVKSFEEIMAEKKKEKAAAVTSLPSSSSFPAESSSAPAAAARAATPTDGGSSSKRARTEAPPAAETMPVAPIESPEPTPPVAATAAATPYDAPPDVGPDPQEPTAAVAEDGGGGEEEEEYLFYEEGADDAALLAVLNKY